MKKAWQHRNTALVILALAALASAACLTWHHHNRINAELSELKQAQPVLAACPIPAAGLSLIIWRLKTDDGEEIRCVHGRIRAADPRAVGPARPGSAS